MTAVTQEFSLFSFIYFSLLIFVYDYLYRYDFICVRSVCMDVL